MGDNEKIILEVKNLSISFKREKHWEEVTHNVCFTIHRGEVLSLVGESGSGKSVSSLAVMGLLDKKISKISSGSIDFFGENKAMIFQEPMTALNPVKKCGAQVDEMILIHKNISKLDAKNLTLNLFEEVLLPDVERVYNSYPFELSGGQRQRVMIAMALSIEPDLLIADEPTTALDTTVQSAILDLIKELQKQKQIAVLFISHDLGVVHNISDRIAVIYKGQIVEQNTSSEIFFNPQNSYTKGLIASRPPIDYKPKKLLTVSDFMEKKSMDVQRYTDEEIHLHNKQLYSKHPILEVKHLNIDYNMRHGFFGRKSKIFHAIDDVSFDVYEGETLGLVGESGSGKTTIGKAITRLIETSSGDIIYKGENLSKLNHSQRHNIRREIQIVFQDPYSSLNPRMQIGSAIMEPMQVFSLYENSSERKSVAIRLLNQVGLNESFFQRYPHELSGGQRQRVCIARALSLQPKLIICDESVSALDVSVQAQVLNLLNELKERFSFTYIFISHDLSVVKYMSDRIIVLKHGQIVEQGLASQIYFNPQTDYTKKLVSSVLT